MSDGNKVRCPDCGRKYEEQGISTHMGASGCKRPPLTRTEENIIIASVLGDGSMVEQEYSGKCSYKMRWNMTNEEYLEHLALQFSSLYTTGVSFMCSGEKNHEYLMKSFDRTTKPEDCKDIYTLSTFTHWQLEEYWDLFGGGEASWPDDIGLNSEIFKHWFVHDGCKIEHENSNNPIICIDFSKEEDNDKVHSYFSHLPVDPAFFNCNCTSRLQFGVKESSWLWKWMGNPLPGFERKWPDNWNDYDPKFGNRAKPLNSSNTTVTYKENA